VGRAEERGGGEERGGRRAKERGETRNDAIREEGGDEKRVRRTNAAKNVRL
jgi:hypothetical protein